MKQLQIIIIGLILISSSAFGQQALVSSGNYFESDNNSMSWTLGELAIETFVTDNYILTQGMQQSRLTVVGIDNYETNTDVEVYPNPTVDFVTIDIKTDDYKDYSYQVVSQSGSNIVNNKFINKSVELSLSEQSQGVYFMRILKGKKVIKSFKIVKN